MKCYYLLGLFLSTDLLVHAHSLYIAARLGRCQKSRRTISNRGMEGGRRLVGSPEAGMILILHIFTEKAYIEYAKKLEKINKKFSLLLLS